MSESANEAQRSRDDLEEALLAAVQALQTSPEYTAVSLTVELQASGQHPYRILTTDEIYPVIGQIETGSGPDSDRESLAAERSDGQEK